jgi:sulfur carrier protein ThiS
MIGNKLNLDQKKIIDAMATVYDKLIEFKKSKDSELVVMKDGKIVRTKPWMEEKN